MDAALHKATSERGSMAGDHEIYGLMLDLAVRDRDQAALDEYLEMAAETAESCEHPLFQAVAARARGVSLRLAGQNGEAGKHLEDALQKFRQLGTRWQIGRTLVELAELDALGENGAPSEEMLSEALTLFEELGAKPDAERVGAMLSAR